MLRAAEHVNELDGRIRQHIQTHTYAVVIDREPGSPWHVGRAHIDDAPLTEWSVILGEIVHNARSALDHLVYQLAVHNGADAEASFTTFPICTSRTRYFKARKNGRASYRDESMVGLTDTQKASIDYLQPFNDSDPDGAVLAILADLHNTDKHRRINTAYSLIESPRPTLVAKHPETTTVDLKVKRSKTLAHGTELFRYAVASPDAEVDVRIPQLKVQFAFGQTWFTLDVLRAMLQEIGSIFEAFAPAFESDPV